MPELQLLRIKWEGAFALTDVKPERGFNERGLYQIYAHHPVFGAGALVYIGIARKTTFHIRLHNHIDPPNGWLSGENDISFRLGRLYRDEKLEEPYDYDSEWSQLLSEAEKLSVFWNTPPYNSHYIKEYNGSMNLRIQNWGNRGSILMEYSSPYWKQPLRPDDSAEE